MTTPLQIDIALHYWTRPTDYGYRNGDNNFDAPAVVTQRAEMVRAGLLCEGPIDTTTMYGRGPALEAYINALCDVPWPVQKWVIPTDRMAAE